MIDLIDIMQSAAVFTFAVVGYILIFQKSGHKRNGHYSIPGWATFIKKYWAERELKIKQDQHKFRELSDFNYFKNERIKIAEDDGNSDSQMIYGSDQDKNSLLIKLTKRTEGNTEIWLILRLKNGMVYTLPDHPNTNAKGIPSSMPFECKGLRIENLTHFKSLRITFNGLLRSNIRKSWSGEYEDHELRFVKFHFIWSAAAAPHHFPNDWSLKLRSIALASEPWRSGDWLNYLLTPDFGGYDQFGALRGQVFIDERELSQRIGNDEMTCFELNLPGIRQRRCLPFYSENQRRYAYIYGVCRDGTVVVIGASSYEESMTHLPFGYIRTPNGKTHSISWTNFHLMYLAEDPVMIAPKALTFQFKANKKMYSAIVHFLKKSAVPLIGQTPMLWKANIVPVEIGINGEQGVGSAVLWYSNPTKRHSIFKDNSSRLYLTPTETKPGNALTLMFNETEAKSLLVSGGKGSSLALLSSIQWLNMDDEDTKFEVPQGFVVSVTAFELQLRRNQNLVKHINSIVEVANGIAEGKLQDICERTVQEFKITPLENEIKIAVTKYYEQIALNIEDSKDSRFAVRSSAIGEDSEDASAAGQNETFLGLRNIVEILESIKLCWASLFTYQSVEYRRQHIQPINTPMSVIVQRMVPSDCAGVLFTRHPGSGDPSKILITANYGLGETVVSGAVDPDSYIVYKRYKSNALRILDRNIGNKQHYLLMSSSSQGNNLVQHDISHANQGKSCLNDEQVLSLSKIGVHLEKLYGNARDVEWAIHENTIYLLQSRPITTLNSFTNWELLHEFDSPIMSCDDFTSFANVGEVFPEVTSPLAHTITTALCKATSEILSKEKDFYNGLFNMEMVMANYRLTFDIFKTFLIVVNKDITMSDKMQAISICGHEFITPEIHRIAKHRNGIASGLKQLELVLDMVKCIWDIKSKLKKMNDLVRSTKNRYSKQNLAEFKDYTASQFNAQIEFEINDEDRLTLAFDAHARITQASVFCQLISMIVLTEGGKEITTEHYADFALMLGFIPAESAEVPRMLKQIADDIYLNGKLNEFENVSPKDGMDWLEVNCISAAELLKYFILKHGHRSLKEFDLSSKTWEMEPELIIQMIQSTCRSSKDILKEKKVKVEFTNSEIIKKLKVPKSKITRKILSFLLPLCISSVQDRETSKSGLVAFIHEIRKAYLHLAELMFSEGLLPNKELLFYLKRYELSELLQKPSTNEKPVNKSAIINKAMRRMKLFPTWNSYRYDEFNKGIVKPINGQDNLQHIGMKTVTGTPVCEGVVTARACVLNDFSEVSKIQSGDILVTRSTDIGWSPYFPILGGVVTELGGLISHGAVVAREYGLPCIVGAARATTILKFGDTITLNAGKGFIVKVDEDESSFEEIDMVEATILNDTQTT